MSTLDSEPQHSSSDVSSEAESGPEFRLEGRHPTGEGVSRDTVANPALQAERTEMSFCDVRIEWTTEKTTVPVLGRS